MGSKTRWLSLSLFPVLLFLGCGKEEEKEAPVRPVKAIKVEDAEALTGRYFPGRAAATEEVNLGFEVGGTLTERPVNKGDKVEKGDLLARLDPRDFKNALAAAEAERDRAKAHRDRIAVALESNAVSKQELTDAEARLAESEALVKIKQKALDDSSIVAPFDGVIAATYVENFQRVQPKEQVLRLLDISRIEFTVDIPEGMISQVPHARDVWVEYDAFKDRRVPAEIKEIGKEASQTTRTYPVTLIMDQPKGFKILPGMAGKAGGEATVTEDDSERGLVVPTSAVFTAGEGGKSYVWVVDEASMTVKRREAVPGELTGGGVQTRGIKPGEWVVTAGVHSLEEGQKVRFMAAPQAEAAE